MLVMLVLILIVTTYYHSRYQEVKTAAMNTIITQASHQLTYSEREYLNVRNQFVSVVNLLSHSRNLYDYIAEPTDEHKTIVEQSWASVTDSQLWYTQVRYLDRQGKEQIRVNFRDGKSVVVSEENLQNKSQRDYFDYAQSLAKNEIGTWGVDLEIERGEVVYPYRPSLRLLTPIYIDEVETGYLILNVDVEALASRLNYAPDGLLRPKLANDGGYFLVSDNQQERFGHVIEERKHFSLPQLFPQAWTKMQVKESGSVMENGDLLVFEKLFLSPRHEMYLVIHLSQPQLNDLTGRELLDLFQEALLATLLVIAVIVPGGVLIFYYRKRSIESQLARAALSGMSAVIISDRWYRAILVNDEFTKLTGLTQQEMLNRNVFKTLLGEKQIEASLHIFEQLATHQFWEGEVRLNSSPLDYDVTVIARVQSVLSKTGSVSYYITSLVDISDRVALEERLRVLSEIDELTQLWNRRKFDAELRKSAKLVERYGESNTTCLALIDIDYFKRINDEQGHDQGDRVIQRVGNLIKERLRDTDFVARIGGEEFAVIMPHTPLEEAERALDRLRVATANQLDIPVTISVGVTDMTNDYTRCYKCADIALYESKTLGRNRVSTCRSSDDIA
ncbi:sensor domain-containing diguanylate cyclase [Vibrio scophthalmi]|uniref:GGDEF domain-containing protein n=1 Tax=Vibrio scophthalmi TaxID=45658 RepID=UPI002FF11051